MTRVETAQKRYDHANDLYRVGLMLFFIYVGVLLTIAVVKIYFVQATIVNNQRINAEASAQRFQSYNDNNAEQHQKTQQYVRCVGQVLLLPLEERTDAAFDQCSKDGTYNGKSSGSTQQPTTTNK